MPPKQVSSQGNASIRSFFKPVSNSQQPSRNSQAPLPSQPSEPPRESPVPRDASPSLPPSLPLSHPSTPKTTGRSRQAVIAASDDDDDDDDDASSDDELEDLMAKFDPRRNVAASSSMHGSSYGPFETPKAKRTMTSSIHSSPLTINLKHKFDMKALAEDAMQDDATNASSLRHKEASDGAAAAAAAAAASRGDGGGSGDAILDIVQERGGANAHKVMRAVKRGTSQTQLRYSFFSSTTEPTPPPASSTVEGDVSTGSWRMLTRGTTEAREQYLVSGLPQTIIRKMGGLPEELFDWILEELCVQKSRLMQQEYCDMLSHCPQHIERRVAPERLEELFLRLGAAEELKTRGEELTLSKAEGDPYQDRDWSCLRSFIGLLGQMAPHMSLPSVKYAAQTLLRMSMDRFLICTVDVLTEYEKTILSLLDAFPSSSWDSFCAETSQLLHAYIKAQSIRTNSLLCLPVSSTRTHDLRRRLAIVFLFNDPLLGGHHPDTVITIRGIINRLDGKDFTVTAETDFVELRASIILLNMAVDDGSFVATSDPEDEKAFNADVDALARRLREIWRRINDSGMKLDRTKTKSVIEWVQQRMSHSVRTRKQMKKSIFDTVNRDDDDASLPQQQNHMRTFLGKPVGVKGGSSAPPPAVSNGS